MKPRNISICVFKNRDRLAEKLTCLALKIDILNTEAKEKEKYANSKIEF
jgi:hypothetical protein